MTSCSKNSIIVPINLSFFARAAFLVLNMKTPRTYAIGIDSDRVLIVSKVDGQLLVTIKVKDADMKCVELTSKRFVPL